MDRTTGEHLPPSGVVVRLSDLTVSGSTVDPEKDGKQGDDATD